MPTLIVLREPTRKRIREPRILVAEEGCEEKVSSSGLRRYFAGGKPPGWRGSSLPPFAHAFAVGESPFVAILHGPLSARATPAVLNPRKKTAMRTLVKRELMATPCEGLLRVGIGL